MFFAVSAVMTAILLSVFLSEVVRGEILGEVFFAGCAIFLAVPMFRAAILGVIADDEGVAIVEPWRTTRIPWDEVVEIQGSSRLTSGRAGRYGAVAPAIVWRRPGRPDKRVELRVLGTYGTQRGMTLVAGAVSGLKRHWKRWQTANR